jgi:hypothetical protein
VWNAQRVKRLSDGEDLVTHGHEPVRLAGVTASGVGGSGQMSDLVAEMSQEPFALGQRHWSSVRAVAGFAKRHAVGADVRCSWATVEDPEGTGRSPWGALLLFVRSSSGSQDARCSSTQRPAAYAPVMQLWRVTVADGLNHRYAGFGVVLAESADEAGSVVAQYLKNDTAYGKPYEVSDVRPHDHPGPHVLFFNWGEWDEWPEALDTPDPPSG